MRLLSSFTLHGDHDEDTFIVLNAMIREGIAIDPQHEVIVRIERTEI